MSLKKEEDKKISIKLNLTHIFYNLNLDLLNHLIIRGL